jgi:CubicO group peptidase (beta-lactamase class C family)
VRSLSKHLLLALLLLGFADWAIAQSFEEKLLHWTQENLSPGFEKREYSAAALTVVKGGKLVLGATFGVADADPPQIASPIETRFRISSITKVMTAVAVAQLLQSGEIVSLDDPANSYLRRIQLPENRGQAVTLHHLLTHSAGFDYSTYGMYAPVQGDDESAKNPALLLPDYVRPAGEWAVYSNYGGALLGVLVEDVSGESLQEYFHNRLFNPLGMSQTELPRARSTASLAVPYQVSSHGVFAPLAVSDYSALMNLSMGIETTVVDMGRFLNFLLTGLAEDGSQILSPHYLELLREQRFTNHAAANGFGMILDVVRQTPAITMYMHNGATPGFSSHMVVVPALNLGAFISVVGQQSVDPRGPIRDFQSAPRLMASFVRELVANYEFVGIGEPRNGNLGGHYLSEKRSLSSPEALFDMFGGTMQREVAENFDYRSNGRVAEEVAPNVYWFEGPYAYREMFRWINDRPYMVIYGSMVLRRVQSWMLPENILLLLLGAATLLGFVPLISICNARQVHRKHLRLLAVSIPLLLSLVPLYVVAQPHGIVSLYQRYQHMDRGALLPVLWLTHLSLALVLVWMICAWQRRGELISWTIPTMFLAAMTMIMCLQRLNVIGEGTTWLL